MEETKKHLEECRRLFDHLPDPGGLLDERGNFLLVTKAFEELMGKKKTELIGTNAFTAGFFDKDFEKIAFNNMKKWLSNKTVPVHDIHLNVKNGRRIIAQTRNSVLKYHGKKAFLFILYEVTEQRNVEKKLRDILMSSSDLVWEVDKHGKIFFISGKVKEIMGYSPEEVMGKTPYFFMDKEESKRCKKVFHEHFLKNENIYDFESKILTKKGEERIFLTNGVPVFDGKGNMIGYRGVEKDITERKKTEERFKALFDNMGSGVAIFRVENEGKKIVFSNFNKAAEKIEKAKREKLLGKEVLSVFPEAKKVGIYDAIRKVWQSGQSEKMTIKITDKIGTETWRNNYIYRLSTGEVAAIYDDVTEEIKMSRALEENEKKFRKIFELSPEAIVIINEFGVIIDLNKRVTEWLGYETKEIIGKSLKDMPFFSDANKLLVVKKFMERMKNNLADIEPYDLEFINKNNAAFVGRVYTRKISGYSSGHNQDLVMISDITKEREAEKNRVERQGELEKMNSLMVGRELKMIELKEKIAQLEKKLKEKNK